MWTACSTPARESRLTEKYVVQTSDQSAQTGGKVNRKKVKQNGGFFDLNEYFVLSPDCDVNSEVIAATAEGRNILSSLLDH